MPDFWVPIFLSLGLALISSMTLVFVGNLFAFWIFFSKGVRGLLIRVLVNLPLVLPPTVMGFYFLVAFSPNTWVGHVFGELGFPLVFSFQGLVLASVIFGLPFMVNPLISSIESLPEAFTELGVVMNRKPVFIYRKMLLPHAERGLIAGAMMTFAHTLGEFGLILMIGGNIPGRTRVAAIEIYNKVIAMDYAHAHLLSGVMLGISVLTLGLIFFWFKKNRSETLW